MQTWQSHILVVMHKKCNGMPCVSLKLSLYIFSGNLTYTSVFKIFNSIFKWHTQMYYLLKFWPPNIIGLGDRDTLKKQFTFYHKVPRNFWYSFYRPWKDRRLSWPFSHPVVLITGPVDWESSTITIRPLLHKA